MQRKWTWLYLEKCFFFTKIACRQRTCNHERNSIMSPVSRIIKKIDAKYSDDKNANFGVLQGSGGGGVVGLGRPRLPFYPFERFEKHGFFPTFKLQIKVISFFQKDYCTGEAPLYAHLIINTVTSQPLSIGRLAERLNFSSKNTSLIRSPVNTAKC